MKFHIWFALKFSDVACRKSGTSSCRTSHGPRHPSNTWLQVEFIKEAASRSRKSCRWSSRESCCRHCYHSISKRKSFRNYLLIFCQWIWTSRFRKFLKGKNSKKDPPSIMRANEEGKLWISKEQRKFWYKHRRCILEIQNCRFCKNHIFIYWVIVTFT